jgi:histidinol-phosphate aminotransferase
VVFVTSPNNPTGRSEPRDTVRALIEQAGEHLIVIDEAYVQFSDTDLLDLVSADAPVIVTRTFSKTWGMAGLRLGYAIASAELISALELVTLPYHVDSAKQIAGELALDFVAEMDARVNETVAERERLRARLIELGVDVGPSDANFLLIDTGSRSAGQVWEGLVERGVLVRDCSGWPGLAGRLRVTVGSPPENDAFLTALEEVLR